MMRTIRRRRKEAKTDYKARLALLKSEKPRLVVRKTNKYIIAQIVESDIAQDKVLLSVSSKDLLSHGWPKENAGSLKSMPACYLTGILTGNKAKEKVKEVVLDTGLNRNTKNSRIFALIKGFLESGIKLTHNEEAIPKDEKINSNEKLAKIVEKVKGGLK